MFMDDNDFSFENKKIWADTGKGSSASGSSRVLTKTSTILVEKGSLGGAGAVRAGERPA